MAGSSTDPPIVPKEKIDAPAVEEEQSEVADGVEPDVEMSLEEALEAQDQDQEGGDTSSYTEALSVPQQLEILDEQNIEPPATSMTPEGEHETLFSIVAAGAIYTYGHNPGKLTPESIARLQDNVRVLYESGELHAAGQRMLNKGWQPSGYMPAQGIEVLFHEMRSQAHDNDELEPIPQEPTAESVQEPADGVYLEPEIPRDKVPLYKTRAILSGELDWERSDNCQWLKELELGPCNFSACPCCTKLCQRVGKLCCGMCYNDLKDMEPTLPERTSFSPAPISLV